MKFLQVTKRVYKFGLKSLFALLFVFTQTEAQNAASSGINADTLKAQQLKAGVIQEKKKSSVPVYRSTGDSVADLLRYSKDKEAYLKETKQPVNLSAPPARKLPESKQPAGQLPEKNEKVHFVIHALQPGVELDRYYRAMATFVRADYFRFYDSDRTINFQGGEVAVTLLSAKSLKEKYGRRISPVTIYKPEEAVPVEFILTGEGQVKESILKWKN